MNLSRPFIERPVATTLLMAAILIAGLLAYKRLPVSALPQVDYPTIRVVTEGVGQLKDGAKVQIRGAEGEQKPADGEQKKGGGKKREQRSEAAPMENPQ